MIICDLSSRFHKDHKTILRLYEYQACRKTDLLEQVLEQDKLVEILTRLINRIDDDEEAQAMTKLLEESKEKLEKYFWTKNELLTMKGICAAAGEQAIYDKNIILEKICEEVPNKPINFIEAKFE